MGELSVLAKNTISKCERIVKKLGETVSGKRGLDSGMRSMLRDMRNLLISSEEKLKEAKETIKTLREKINKVLATLRVFKGLIKAAKTKDENLKRGLPAEDIQNILGGITKDIMGGVDGYQKAKKGDGTASVLGSILGGITRLTAGIIKAVNRPDVGPKLDSALRNIDKAIRIVQEKKAMEKEAELIIMWKDAVLLVKQDVFGGNLKERTEKEDQDLYEEIEEIIEDGDVQEIYDSFNGLRDAAS